MGSTASADGLVSLHNMSFLVVGDATGVADALARALDGEGATVRRAASHADAITDLAARSPDVVLAHYSDTHAENAAFVDRVRCLDAGESSLALAAFCEGDCEEALGDGFDGVVTAPFERAPLLSSIRSAVERAGQRRDDAARRQGTGPSDAGARAGGELGVERGGNLILASLSDAAFRRVAASLSPVRVAAGTVLAEEGEPASHLYFLGEGVASRIVRFRNRASADVGVVGREGFVDLETLLRRGGSPFATVVRVDARAWRMPIEAGFEAMRDVEEFRDAVLRYAAARETESTMSSVCVRVHSAESRLARWLLVVRAATGTDRFPLTQEVLASIVGLRRAGVTVAARALKTAGIIDYSWGQIRITDLPALEARACECYHLVREWLAR